MRTEKNTRYTLMPPARRRKKTGLFSLLKLTAKTKKRLVRYSIALNIIALCVGVYAIQHSRLRVSLAETAKAVTAQFRAVQQRVLDQRPPRSSTALRNKPKLAFVIDDMGNTMNDRQLLRDLGNSVTYAVLPLLPYSRFFGLLSGETGAEVILHLPLESVKGTIPGPGLITNRMPASQIMDVLNRSLASVPRQIGVNNHMGSAGTNDPRLMRLILEELKHRRLFFLDSMTTPRSVAYGTAKKLGVPALKRDVFLDNIDSPASIRAQITAMTEMARKKGYAVAIGHYRYNTLSVLKEEISRLRAAGFQIVSLSTLITSEN